MRKEIVENFGNTLRVRVCGILIDSQKVLMVRHQGLSEAGFWSPPGGGMEFGESAAESLRREFEEETGLQITVGKLLFINEFREDPLHALELFFRVQKQGGTLKVGTDPELEAGHQIIDNVRYFGKKDLELFRGPQLHAIFHKITHPEELLNLEGYFQNWK